MTKIMQAQFIKRSGPNRAQVMVETIRRHPLYRKQFKVSRKFTVVAGDDMTLEPGQMVTIKSIRPVAKTVYFEVVK